jgi:hypothetical protein
MRGVAGCGFFNYVDLGVCTKMGRNVIIIILIICVFMPVCAADEQYEFSGDRDKEVVLPEDVPYSLQSELQNSVGEILQAYVDLWDSVKVKFPFVLFTEIIAVFNQLGSADNSWDGVIKFQLIGRDWNINVMPIPGVLTLIRSVWGFLIMFCCYKYIFGMFVKNA